MQSMRDMMRWTLAAGLAGLFSAGAIADSAPNSEWSTFGRDGSEQHFSPVAEINTQNVARLGLAWHHDLTPSFTVSTPVQANGRLFITTGHSHIQAFNAATGKLLWEWDARTREIAQLNLHMSWGNKGIAWSNGKVIVGTTDGRVIALDLIGKRHGFSRLYDATLGTATDRLRRNLCCAIETRRQIRTGAVDVFGHRDPFVCLDPGSRHLNLCAVERILRFHPDATDVLHDGNRVRRVAGFRYHGADDSAERMTVIRRAARY